MADVVLDDLYASAGENAVQQQQEAPAAEAEAAPGADIKSLSHEQLLESLRTQLQELRDKFSAVEKVPEFVDIAAKARAICAAARSGAARHAHQQQTSAILEAANTAAAAGGDPVAAKVAAAAAAAAQQTLTPEAVQALLPAQDDDDGTSCLLLQLLPQHSEARVRAITARYGPEPARVYKQEGCGFALVVYGDAEARGAFASTFVAAQQLPNAANKDLVLLLPGEGVPGDVVATLNGKRRRDAPARKDKRGREEARGQQRGGGSGGVKDIRSVVCPWWDRPYQQQLKSKMDTVLAGLKQITVEVTKGYQPPYPPPAWLLAAQSSPNRAAVQLPGIIRSSQLDGYRNKAEFSVGLDDSEQPIVGFLQGNFVDGHTQVADPSGCRHMSPTSLAYAAAVTAFLRSADNKLPPWDKRKGQGFWRLLVVREGRDQTFLPLPAVASDADGQQQQQKQQQQQQPQRRVGQAPEPPVLGPTALADLPVDRWLVRNPAAAAAGQGMSLEQVREGEASAPHPSHVLVMVQINPLAAPGGPSEIKQQLAALEIALKAAARQQGLPLTSLAVQYHSGVSNAAPASAPFTSFGVLPPVAAAGAGGVDADMQDAAGADAPAAAAADGGVLGISDALCELKFRVSPTAFYQVNAAGTCALYHTIGKMAGVGPNSLLLDVCCGTGTIGLTLAKQVAKVVGIDNVQSAIDDAQVNAQLNGISNASFVCGPAEKVMEGVLQEYAPQYPHVVAVVDPPRAGLHKDVLLALLACPAIKRLVFVSCNPDSLVLNSKLLCGRYRPDINAPKVSGDPRRAKRQKAERGPVAPMPRYEPFRPTAALAFDLFPHTAHVETVVLYERD